MNIETVVLKGEFIRLEPLKYEHAADLYDIASDDEIWQWVPIRIKKYDDLEKYVETALTELKSGSSLPFVTIEQATGQIVGCTRFGNIDTKNRRVEIGWTWIGKNWQRTYVNTEAKLLMLRHAFETWRCIRVEFKTDLLNERSKNAILRLGAKQEGIFRRHMITDTGRVRDTVYFSILDSEWAAVKERLSERLKASNKL